MAKIENACRLCLRNEPKYYLFDETLSWVSKIEAFCSFKIHDEQNLPKFICSDCCKAIDAVIAFKTQCENNHFFLMSQVQRLITIEQDDSITIDSVPLIKDEPCSEDTDSVLNCSEDARDDETLYAERNSMREANAYSSATLKIQNQCEKPSTGFPLRKNKEYVKARTCPFCSETFTRTNIFEEHLRTHRESPYECDICQKTFISRKFLICHMIVHRKGKQCDLCGAVLKNLYGLQRHIKYVHETVQPLTCKVCKAIFSRSDNLKAHMRAHKRGKRFECDICNQKFTLKSTKVCHMRTHTGEKPYKCKYCDAKFSRSGTLLNHVKLHTGEITHHCIICFKGFIRLSDYKMHLRKKHNDLDIKINEPQGKE